MGKQPVHWKRRILLPIWFLRIIAMLFVIVAFGLAIKLAKDRYGYTVNLGVLAVFYLFIIIVLLMDILQILMFLRDNLSPGAFLAMNTLQTAFWGAVLIMDFVYIGKDHTSAAGIGLVIFLFLLFLALLVYAAVGFHRQRKQAKQGNYAPAHNPAMPATASPSYHVPSIHQQSTAYHSPMHAGGDLGQFHSPYPTHGAAADYYTEQPTKPAQMV